MIAIDDSAATSYAVPRNAMPKKAEEKIATVMVGVRLTQRDADRLDAIQARIGIATRHAVAREALRIGLDALEEDSSRRAKPDRVNGAPPPKRKARRRAS